MIKIQNILLSLSFLLIVQVVTYGQDVGDVLIKNGTVITITDGVKTGTDILVRDGKSLE